MTALAFSVSDVRDIDAIIKIVPATMGTIQARNKKSEKYNTPSASAEAQAAKYWLASPK